MASWLLEIVYLQCLCIIMNITNTRLAVFKSILHNLFAVKTPYFMMNNTVEKFCPDERCMDGVDQSIINIFIYRIRKNCFSVRQ